MSSILIFFSGALKKANVWPLASMQPVISSREKPLQSSINLALTTLDTTHILILLIITEMIHWLHEERQQLLREMCARDKGAKEKYSLDNFNGKELRNLIVDDNHGIIYCYIPKVI